MRSIGRSKRLQAIGVCLCIPGEGHIERKLPMAAPILVADFDFTRRYVIAYVLRAAGYEVTEVTDAVETEQALAGRTFALAFIAARLSGGDGFDVCRRWSARGLRVVLVASDFRGSELLRAQAAEAGAVDVLSSMVDRDKLVSIVNRLLERSHTASG
jgi:DNA-binding response OmpR family regulator